MCEIFQIDQHMLTFQGHPKISKEYSKTLMERRIELIGKQTVKKRLDSLSKETQHETIAEWIIQFVCDSD